jgi:glutamate/aspartate transport system substrate-binding protein
MIPKPEALPHRSSVRATAIAMLAGASLLAAGASHAQSGTVEKLRETNTIVLGVQESSIPFSYLDENQDVVGYSVDLCMGIVDALKEKLSLPDLKVEKVPVTSATRIPLIVNGTIDLQCGSTTNNAERRQQVDFSYPFFFAAAKVMVPVARGIETVEDLKGKTVVTTAGGTPQRVMNEVSTARGLELQLPTSTDHAEGFLMVQTGRADAVANDDALLYGLRANARTPADWKVLSEPLSREPYGLIVRKDDPEFKAAVNEALAAMYADGTAESHYMKWFTNPIPPRGANLEMPLSDELKQAYAEPREETD